MDPIESYIRSAAIMRGINPDIAMRVSRSEGFNSYVGDSGSSFGPFQLHYGGVAPGGNSVSGLGDVFTSQTGLDARDPNTVPQQIDFALDHAAKNGWGAWHGWKGDQFAGISNNNQSNGTPRMADDNGALFQLAQNNGGGFDFGQAAAGLQDAGAGLMSINNPAALAGANHLAAYRNKMTPQLVETGTDPFTGQKTFGLYNPASRSFIQMNANGQVSSSGGTPSGNTLQAFRQAMLDGKTGDELLQYAPPEARSYIEALKRGDANPMYMGRGVGGAQRAALNEMAHAIYPDMTDANIAARQAEAKNLATSNNPSTLGGAVASMGKVSLHAIDLLKASEDLAKLQTLEQSTIANTAENFKKNLGTDVTYKSAVSSLRSAAELYGRENDRLTSGGHPTLAGQEAISSLFSPNISHEERVAALRKTMGMAQDATDQLVYNNNRAFGRLGTPEEKTMEDFMSPSVLKAWNTVKNYGTGSAQVAKTPQAPAAPADPLTKARAAIAAGADRGAVVQRLKQFGIDPGGL